MNIASPCIRICRLDHRGVCAGCFRTLEEIARWTQMSDPEKYLVMAVLAERRGNSTADKGGEAK